MEEMKKNMIGKIGEMENKIESTEVELEDERMTIEQLGMDIMELVVKMQSGGLRENERKERKSGVEIEKISKTKKFQEKKEGLTALVMKKKELEREVHIVQQYLVKYMKELKEKERIVMVEMILSSDEEEVDAEKKGQISIVLNTIEHL